MRRHRPFPRALLSAALLALFALPFLVGCSGDGPQALRGAPNLGGGDGGGPLGSGGGSGSSRSGPGSFDSGSFGSGSGSFDSGSERRGPSIGSDSGDEGDSGDDGPSNGGALHKGSGRATTRVMVAKELELVLHAIGANAWDTACKYVFDGAISELQLRRDAPQGSCPTVLAWWMNETVADVYPSYRGASVDPDQIDATSRVARVPASAITYSPPLDDPEFQSLNAIEVDLIKIDGRWKVRTLIG